MNGYKGSIEEAVLSTTDFRKVLYTGEKVQLVAMTLQPREDIGAEDHDGHDQFFHIVSGEGEVQIGEDVHVVTGGDLVVIPSGVLHNVTNTSDSELMRMYTTYSPAEHADGTVHATKTEAEASEHSH